MSIPLRYESQPNQYILDQLPSAYRVMLEVYDHLFSAVLHDMENDKHPQVSGTRDEKMDDGLFRVFWLLTTLKTNHLITRTELAENIISKMKVNEMRVDENMISAIKDEKIGFLTAFDLISTSCLEFMGI